MSNSTFSLPCPPTPIMLYVGAGYDLSPLLTFAPGGPPYPIVPLSKQGRPDASFAPADEHATYTSFLFVDAKPRHTSAYMVSDFHEWTSIESRVRNVLHYAQGTLSRWRTVPGAPDLLWFEGGGDAALVESRSREPAWVFPLPDPEGTSSSVPHSSAERVSSPTPLTTLLYLFNTLDVELVRAPLLENVLSRVEALYVHGLQLHARTGAGLNFGPRPIPNVSMSSGSNAHDLSAGVETGAVYGPGLPTQLGIGLKRCYVIVGSWGTPLRNRSGTRHKDSRSNRLGREERAAASVGVRHVDFVREAWRRWKVAARTCPQLVGGGLSGTGACLPSSLSPSPISSSPALPSTPSSGSLPRITIETSQCYTTPSSPLIFRRPRVRHSVSPHHNLPLDDGWDSDCDGDSDELYTDWIESESDGDGDGGGGLLESTLLSTLPISGPFCTRIPQLAWSSALRGGRGGYYVEKTVEESVAVWRARKGWSLGDSEEDDSGSEGEFNVEADSKRNEIVRKKKGVHYLYSLRSFFRMLAPAPPTPHVPTQFSSHSPVTSRSRTPPPRSRRRLRPRPPTPAPGSEITDSEDSASEAEFEVDHRGSDHPGKLSRCDCQRRREWGTNSEMGSEKEGLSCRFWRRTLRAPQAVDQLNCRVRVENTCVTRARSKSMSHIDQNIPHLHRPSPLPLTDNKARRITAHNGASPHSRNTSSMSLDTSSSPSTSSAYISPGRSRERRIDIVDFLNMTSDPMACNTDTVLSSNGSSIPASISDSGPLMLSSVIPRDSFTLTSAGPAVSSFYHRPLTSTLWSFSSPSISPSSTPTSSIPVSPYGPSGFFDDDANVEQKSLSWSMKRRTLALPSWATRIKQQHEKEHRESKYVSRTGSFFRWKSPTARLRDVTPPRFPSSPTSAHTSLLTPLLPSTDSQRNHAPCVQARYHSHSRARTTTPPFRFDPDAPPVPPLPSHFRGHNHTRSACEPMPMRREADLPHSRTTRTCLHARTPSNALFAPIPSFLTPGDNTRNRSMSAAAPQNDISH